MANEVIVDVEGQAEGSIIWLHGLGADGHDFEAIVPELRLSDEVALRFVFPHAPIRSVTLNNGMDMRAWYDIYSLDRAGPQDEQGIRDSAELLLSYVEREHSAGIPYEKIVLAGFSQGGAIALHTALRMTAPLAGLMALSTYLPLQDNFAKEVTESDAAQSREIPIFMAHGSFDPVLPMALGSASAAILTDAGYNVDWREYPMPHSVCPPEIDDIRNWLLTVYKQ